MGELLTDTPVQVADVQTSKQLQRSHPAHPSSQLQPAYRWPRCRHVHLVELGVWRSRKRARCLSVRGQAAWPYDEIPTDWGFEPRAPTAAPRAANAKDVEATGSPPTIAHQELLPASVRVCGRGHLAPAETLLAAAAAVEHMWGLFW